jgi:CheY-like chemotaxis protein
MATAEAGVTGWVVLLVDDEESIRGLGQRLLGRLGFHVLTAVDGRDALEVYVQHKDEIVLVLLDLTMPRMGGEETLRELRRLDPEVRVVLSSGYAESEVTSRFSGDDIAGFVQKPYSLDDLKQRMRAALDG